MDQQRREQIIGALTGHGVMLPCPRCGNGRFDLIAETHIFINETPGTLQIGGPSVPVVLVACDRCGCVTQHAQGPLGVMRTTQ